MFKYLPNFLSIIRLFLSIPAFYYTYHGQGDLAILIICLGLLTDYLDGYLARKHDLQTKFGLIIDPLSDKIFFISVAIAMLLAGSMPVWFFVIAAARDIAILLGGLVLKGRIKETPESDIFGKFYFASLLVMILLVLAGFEPAVTAGFEMITTALVVSVISYAFKFVSIWKQNTTKKR